MKGNPDMEPKDAMKLIEKQFGSLPAQVHCFIVPAVPQYEPSGRAVEGSNV